MWRTEALGTDVVIVNWNGGPELVAAVRSALRFGGRPIVVDNASTSGSLEQVVAIPGVDVVRLPTNRGFAAGCNAGAAAGDGDALIFLNPDAEILAGTDAELRVCLAAAGPLIVAVGIEDAAGRRLASVRRLPTSGDVLALLLRVNAVRHRAGRQVFGGGRPGDVPPAPLDERSGFVTGAAFAMRRSDWESLGGMDEGFFLWMEEVDLCQRLLARGGRLALCPAIRVRHRGGMSWGRLPRWQRQRLRVLSASRYARRHLGKRATLAVTMAAPTALAMGLALDVWHAVVRQRSDRHVDRANDGSAG